MDASRARNKHNQHLFDQAAEWFVEFREGEVDAATERDFHQWLRTSPEHIAAYLEVAAFWADVPNVASKQDIDVAELVAYARAEDNVVALDQGFPTKPLSGAESPSSSVGATVSNEDPRRWTRRLRVRPSAAAAAILLMLVGTATTVWFSLYPGSTYATTVGEQRSIALDDGSTVELNVKSRIRVHFTEHERAVELLEGQALFRVAKNPTATFVVRSGATRVQAVGTQFEVYRRRARTTVTVLEGRVAVLPDASSPRETTGTNDTTPVPAMAPRPRERHGAATPDVQRLDVHPHMVLVSAGEQLDVTGQHAQTAKPADIPAATAWMQRQLVFQATPLAEVVEEFNRYNKIQMVVTARSLDNIHVSGIFSSTQPASLLHFLSEQVGLRIDEGDHEVRISPR